MYQKILLLIIFLLPMAVLGQESVDEEDGKESWPAYLEMGFGAGLSSFRDKATSPLFYRGMSLTGSFSRVKINDRKETNFGLGVTTGGYEAEVNERQVSTASFNSISLGYTRLYQIPKWSDDNWNYKTGGLLMTTANFRSNERLQNNSFGFEAFLNLMGSFKVSRDVSRKEVKNKKLWFINYTLKPRKRSLSYQLNLGLWNNSLRNGYAYIDQAGVLNEESFIWEGYEFRTFSGLRFSSELSYTLFLIGAKNNAIKVAYLWDAVRTASGEDNFAMAFHVIKFSLLYNTR